MDRWQEPPSQPERQIIVEMCNARGGLLGSWDPWVCITQLHTGPGLEGYWTIFHMKGCNPKNPGPMCS